MTAIPPATHTPIIVPPRRSHGCLWGCLALIAVILLPVIGTVGYAGWYLHEGFRRDPALRVAAQMLRRDGLAKRLLGENIEITGIEGNAFSATTGWGRQGAYIASLKGSKGAGTLELVVESRAGRPVVRSMILIGPDGRSYNLLTDRPVSPPGPTNSI